MIQVIIVDDDNLVRLGLSTALPWAKYDMVVAGTFSNGLKALEFISQSPVDLVLLDLEMPGMTGIELLRFIKKDYPNIACVILTMHQDFSFIQDALRQGALDYILKVELEPESFDEVLNRIKRRIQQSSHASVQSQENKPANHNDCSPDINECIQKAVYIIHNETGVHLNAVDVAKRVNMSRSYFSLCFKKIVGKPFNDYFKSVRIEQAKEMLINSRSSIKWIASVCGFSDERYFSTMFRQNTGLLPREFRKKGG